MSGNRFERFASEAMAARLHVLTLQNHVHSHESLYWVITRDVAGVGLLVELVWYVESLNNACRGILDEEGKNR